MTYNERSWLDAATGPIRFRPDRAAVRAELEAHIEDKTADLRRIFPDMGEGEVRERALSQMGDPEALGRELAAIHKPWLGYLWLVSKVLVILAVVLTALLWLPRGIQWVTSRDDLAYTVEAEWENCLNGTAGELPDRFEGAEPVFVVPRPGESVRAGDYDLRVERAALWYAEEEDNYKLSFELSVLGPPWQDLSAAVPHRLVGTDSLGNRYGSTETYSGGPSEDAVIIAGAVKKGLLREKFWGMADIPGTQPPEWFHLDYDYKGARWSLTIPLTEEE